MNILFNVLKGKKTNKLLSEVMLIVVSQIRHTKEKRLVVH